MSKRSPAPGRLARAGFQQIPEPPLARMNRPNDATIDIPLHAVTSRSTHLRGGSGFDSGTHDEKSAFFRGREGLRRMSSRTDDIAVTRMGKIYDKILNFSIVTRYFFYVLPVALVIAIPIVIGATVAKGAEVGASSDAPGVRIVWVFTWVEIVWLSLWVSKLFAKSLPFIFQFLCGIVSAGTRKYALVLTALEIPISLAGWALASLATFEPLMTHNPDQRLIGPFGPTAWELVMQQILAAFLVTSLIFLIEKFLVQMISISYHRKQYDLKIQESKDHVHLLCVLYDASRALFPAYCPEFAEEDNLINDSIQIGGKKGSNHARSGSATPLRLLQNVGRFGDNMVSKFGHVAHEITGKQVFNPTSAHSIVVEALEKIKSSEALAKRIWMSFVVEGKEALYEQDILEVLGEDQQAEAERAFASLDKDGNGDISLDEMILAVCEVGRQRKAIASSMHDVDQAIDVLDNLLLSVAFIVCVFVFVAFLNANLTTTLATAGTALLSMSFVFASTAAEVLSSCIFIFVKHPFDVGDRVDIGGEPLVVERISLLFTTFRKVKDHRNTQVPNTILNTNWIDNISRSKAMREQLLMYISFDTTLEDIQLLKNEIQKFVLDKENSRDFQADVDVEVTGIAEMNKMELKVEIKHKSNWSNESVRAARRSKFMCALVLALRKIPIYAPGGGGSALGSADQPTYTVSVSDAEAADRRAAFAKAKEGKRMVTGPGLNKSNYLGISSGASNSNSPVAGRDRSPTIASQFETAALISLNSRSPVVDVTEEAERGSGRSPTSPTDRRSTEVDEVRNMLRRQSTQGKRRGKQTMSPQTGMSHQGVTGIPIITEPNLYHQYSGATVNPVPSKAAPTSSPNSPEMLPIQGKGEGFGGDFNPYMQHSPRYERPPTSSASPKPPATAGPGGMNPLTVNPYSNDGTAIPAKVNRNNSFPAEMAAPPHN